MLYWYIMEGIPTDRTLLDEMREDRKPTPWKLWEDMGKPINTPFKHTPGCQRIFPGELRCQCWDRAPFTSPFPNRATRRSWKARGLIDATR